MEELIDKLKMGIRLMVIEESNADIDEIKITERVEEKLELTELRCLFVPEAISNTGNFLWFNYVLSHTQLRYLKDELYGEFIERVIAHCREKVKERLSKESETRRV